MGLTIALIIHSLDPSLSAQLIGPVRIPIALTFRSFDLP